MSSSDLESQVRRSLGATSPSSAHKERLRQRANVEVVVRPARSHGMRHEDQAELRAALEARDKSDQALAVAQTTIRSLQTKAAHWEICVDELREQNRRALARIEVLEADLAVRLEAQHSPKVGKRVVARSDRLAPTTDCAAHAQTDPPPKGASGEETNRKDKASYRSNPKPVDWWSHHKKKAGRR